MNLRLVSFSDSFLRCGRSGVVANHLITFHFSIPVCIKFDDLAIFPS